VIRRGEVPRVTRLAFAFARAPSHLPADVCPHCGRPDCRWWQLLRRPAPEARGEKGAQA
jgi:hypothetical protein